MGRNSRAALGAVGLMLLSATWTSCGSDTPTPAAPAPVAVTPPAPATVTGVAISGNLAFTTIGETTQLTATATLSDNTTKNVTSDGQWQSADVRIVTVSTSGILTVVGYGSTYIAFSTGNRGTSKAVTATPPGTFTVAGRVREPGRGGLVNVLVVDTLSRRSSLTGPDGQFSLAELRSPQVHLIAERERYESAETDATGTNIDLPLQEVIRLSAGETTYPAPLAPNDLSYTVGGRRCSDCRVIHVFVPQAGTVHIQVTWTVAASQLSLFAEGQVVKGTARELTADVPINASREVLMYLGAEPPNAVGTHTPFTFATSLR